MEALFSHSITIQIKLYLYARIATKGHIEKQISCLLHKLK